MASNHDRKKGQRSGAQGGGPLEPFGFADPGRLNHPYDPEKAGEFRGAERRGGPFDQGYGGEKGYDAQFEKPGPHTPIHGAAPPSRPSEQDHALQDSLEALVRSKAPLEGDTVRVEVHSGEVTLHGVVRDAAARQSIESAVEAAPGVARVRSFLGATAPSTPGKKEGST